MEKPAVSLVPEINPTVLVWLLVLGLPSLLLFLIFEKQAWYELQQRHQSVQQHAASPH
jgi:hypothetical protein